MPWTLLTAAGGGLRDQILGTLLLMAGVLILAGTVGVLAGIHLSEMAKIKKNGKASGGLLRTASDIFSGFPSIVLGYVGYAALVLYFHWGFSYLAAVIILSVMVEAYIAKTTENSLRQVPTGYREGCLRLRDVDGLFAAQGRPPSGSPPCRATEKLLALAIACAGTPCRRQWTWTSLVEQAPRTRTSADSCLLPATPLARCVLFVPLLAGRRDHYRDDVATRRSWSPRWRGSSWRGQPHHPGADPAPPRVLPPTNPLTTGPQARRPRQPARRGQWPGADSRINR